MNAGVGKIKQTGETLRGSLIAKGDDGFSPVVTTEETEAGYEVTITDIQGKKTMELRHGKKGDPGPKGDPGTTDYNELENKPTIFVTPNEFGAVGDGKTDDTQAIQSAFDHAIANNIPLYIPTGMYVVTSTIRISDTLNVYGDGQSTQNQRKSVIYLVAGDEDIPLFDVGDGNTQLARCTFTNVTFFRKRTEGEGFPEDPLAYGKSGCAFGCLLNECSFHRCTFMGFGSVCLRAAITDFIDCDIVYCDSILSNSTHANAVNFIGLNLYACGTLFRSTGNLSGVNFTNCWIEDFVSILDTPGVTVHGLNFSGCTLTNTAKGEALIKHTNPNGVFKRMYITFSKSLIHCKKNVCDTTLSGIEHLITFDDCQILYGGTGEVITIKGNSKLMNLSGANLSSDITFYTTGFDDTTGNAYSRIKLSRSNTTTPYAVYFPNHHMVCNDRDGNKMVMLPCYYEFTTIPSWQVRCFQFNTQCMNTGDWVLRFCFRQSDGTLTYRNICTL